MTFILDYDICFIDIDVDGLVEVTDSERQIVNPVTCEVYSESGCLFQKVSKQFPTATFQMV